MSCADEQAALEEIWQHFEDESLGNKLHMLCRVEGIDDWDDLNGPGWRTKSFPNSGVLPIKYELSTMTGFPMSVPYDIFASGNPYNMVIGKDYKVKFSQVEFDTTDSYSAYKTLIGDAIDEMNGINDEGIVRNFSLAQNYPNPFNPSTTIKFDLKSNIFVNLTVYNSAGKEVANLINGKIAQGEHIVGFSADNFSAGIYYYKLTAGNYSESKKMLLVK